MNILKVLVLVILLLAVVGCSAVRSVNQVGESIYPLTISEWDGTWVTGDGSLVLEVRDSKTGELEIMFIEKGELEKHTVFVKQIGNDSYMNLVDKDSSYLFAKFKKSRNQVIVWLPSAKEIKLAISNKQLDGLVDGDSDLLIKSDKSSLNKYFEANKEKMLFEYEEPVVFRKLNH